MARRGKYKNPVRQSCCNKGMERKILVEFRVHLAPHALDRLPIVLHTQKFEKNSRQGSIMEGTGWQVSSRKFRTVGINYELGVFLRLGRTMKTSNSSKKDWKI